MGGDTGTNSSPDPKELSEADRESVRDESTRVKALFTDAFSDPRLLNASRLLRRYHGAVNRLLKGVWSDLSGVNEAHNELCVAHALLKVTEPHFASIEYEPPLAKGGATIDFRCVAGASVLWMDVKTIQPAVRDRWDHFERILGEKRIPPGVSIELHKDWLGGELWHNKVTARSRMLEHSISLERKIESCEAQGGVAFALALCGSGFHWHVDELEDFVAYYRTGRHRMDDGLAHMESHHLQTRSITLSRKIAMFSYLGRPQAADFPERIIWNVRAPAEPWLSGNIPAVG